MDTMDPPCPDLSEAVFELMDQRLQTKEGAGQVAKYCAMYIQNRLHCLNSEVPPVMLQAMARVLGVCGEFLCPAETLPPPPEPDTGVFSIPPAAIIPDIQPDEERSSSSSLKK